MNTNLSQLIPDVEPRASASIAATRPVFALSSPPEPFFAQVAIRIATRSDRRVLERLAQLDSALPPVGQTLIGEVQGRAVVAVSLGDGRAIADPFVAAEPIVELVRLRAEQLRPRSRPARSRRLRHHH